MSTPPEERRDENKMYNKKTIKQLGIDYPQVCTYKFSQRKGFHLFYIGENIRYWNQLVNLVRKIF